MAGSYTRYPATGDGGADTVGTIDSQTKSSNGAVITGTDLIMQTADATAPGLVSATTQTFAGNKTFTGTIAASNFSGASTGTNTGDVTLTAVGSSPSANAASLSGQALTLQPADGTRPGVITAGTQTIGGAKTFSGAITASNLSGTNTGDVTLAAVGSSPNANGATLTAQALNLQPADATNPGVVTTGTQTMAGAKTFSGGITATVTGTASGNTTITPNNHGVVVSGAANALTVIAPDASATKVLKSGGASADPSWLAYDTANTASTLVARDGSGNFTAGTVTAALTGTASGNTTYSANNHGVVVSSATNAMTVVAPNASTAFPLISGGASADPAWAGLTVAGGGTGLAATTGYAVLCGGTTSTAALQSIASVGTSGHVLTSNGAAALPTFQAPAAGTIYSWSGYTTTAATWSRTNAAFGDFTATGTPVITERTNSNFGTVTQAGSSLPGITFNPPATGMYLVTANVVSFSSGPNNSAIRLWDGTTVVAEANVGDGSASSRAVSGIYNAASLSAVTLTFQGKDSGGSAIRIGFGVASSAIEWSILKIH